ncbi:hypothetical protein [Halobaculum sp. P14]|uniref:hypothetical protein n=1 Tax=Halobaculum sp. P14 TaxID=3421638 RepID=UPI003EBF1253
MSTDDDSPALAAAKRIGTDVEALVVESVQALRAVPDSAAEHYDAVAVQVIDGHAGTRLGGTPLLPRGAEVEIKAAREQTSNGSVNTPGRWYFRGGDTGQHASLVQDAAYYALAVYREGLNRVLLDVVLVPASLVDELLRGRWYDSGNTDGQVAKLGWPSVFGGDDW